MNKGASEKSYNGVADAFKSILKNEGPTAFFKGALCRMIVIAPLFGIAQMVYYFGIAEYLMGIDKSSPHIPSTSLQAVKSEDANREKWSIVPKHIMYDKWSQILIKLPMWIPTHYSPFKHANTTSCQNVAMLTYFNDNLVKIISVHFWKILWSYIFVYIAISYQLAKMCPM